MGMGNFFDKAALGAAQILKGFDRKNFEEILMNQRIGIVFDKVAAESHEGRATLDLLVRLTARLYPNLQIINLNDNNVKLLKKLEECAKSINPEINLSKSEEATINLIVGNTTYQTGKNTKFYIGSDEWIAKLSTTKPVGSVNSNNPFGAGAAACFGAANVFRMVFKNQLTKGECDKDFSVSLFDYIKSNTYLKNNGPKLDKIHLDETQLIGIGAIGNSVIWALGNIPGLIGKLEIIDNQEIDLTNLQRYVLASQGDVNKSKVILAKEFMSNSQLTIKEQPYSWEKYVQNRKDWLIKKVAVCVDSAKDRIIVQSSLPKKIFNAWTQPASIGVSRHLDFINNACIVCLYLPDSKKKNKSEMIAESLGLSEHEPLIRRFIATQTPVDEMILSLVSNANSIPLNELEGYKGKHMEIFYSEVVCGGVLMRLNPNAQEIPEIEVPSAFESALAGILLASEIIIDAGNLRNKNLPSISKFNLLRPLSSYLLEDQHKHHSLRCICQDPIFQKSYKKKWLLTKNQ